MARKAPGFGDTLGRWLIDEGLVPEEQGPGSLADVARVRALLIAAAHERRAVSYSELLGQLGHRFTRPKMRTVCKTLDAIDSAGAAGEPNLAVLVVRETDRLPGQGWWVGARDAYGYHGEWTGSDAAALVARLQAQAFDYWGATKRRG
jgi:hypothetical protein